MVLFLHQKLYSMSEHGQIFRSRHDGRSTRLLSYQVRTIAVQTTRLQGLSQMDVGKFSQSQSSHLVNNILFDVSCTSIKRTSKSLIQRTNIPFVQAVQRPCLGARERVSESSVVNGEVRNDASPTPRPLRGGGRAAGAAAEHGSFAVAGAGGLADKRPQAMQTGAASRVSSHSCGRGPSVRRSVDGCVGVWGGIVVTKGTFPLVAEGLQRRLGVMGGKT